MIRSINSISLCVLQLRVILAEASLKASLKFQQGNQHKLTSFEFTSWAAPRPLLGSCGCAH